MESDEDFFLSSQGVERPGRQRSQQETLYKLINDPIHGLMKIQRESFDIIDTRQFQRLRELKQLGSCYFIFPGASHNRFEHCIGVGHLARRLLTTFRDNQPELGISNRDLFLVEVAGMCHDLGHGPFSHVFDNTVLPTLAAKNPAVLGWKHEKASSMMLDRLIDENQVDMDASELKLIKQMIEGDRGSYHGQKRFLFDIVANSRNSVDVDKFDYLQRDCHNLGIRSTYDFSRLMNFSRVINDEICFHAKEAFNVYEMFHTRYVLFKQVYTHRVARAIEFMIADALVEADQTFDICSAVFDAEQYLQLTDSILREIEKSKEPALNNAKKIVRNIWKRNLYKFASEALVHPAQEARVLQVTPLDISSSQAGDGSVQIRPEDIIVDHPIISYGMKDKNPVESVRFFKTWEDTNSVSIPKDKVSFLIPDKFHEQYIRVYSRDPDPAKVAAVRTAFERFMNSLGGATQVGPVDSNTKSSVTPQPPAKRARTRLEL